ncbi:MAG: hypothetical protein HJJLKODD_02386 [Phycisphaerae bacterium]|nr:hypothetical protein [Phycisphaerae bacterium]
MRKILMMNLLVLLGASTGCLMDISSSSTVSGRSLPNEEMDQVMEGQTTRAWLVEHLGEPCETRTLDNGLTELVYRQELVLRENFGVIFLINAHKTTTTTQETIFQLKDDVVIHFFRRAVIQNCEA